MAYTTVKTFATQCCLVVKSEFIHHASLPDRRPPRAPIPALNDLGCDALQRLSKSSCRSRNRRVGIHAIYGDSRSAYDSSPVSMAGFKTPIQVKFAPSAN